MDKETCKETAFVWFWRRSLAKARKAGRFDDLGYLKSSEVTFSLWWQNRVTSGDFPDNPCMHRRGSSCGGVFCRTAAAELLWLQHQPTYCYIFLFFYGIVYAYAGMQQVLLVLNLIRVHVLGCWRANIWWFQLHVCINSCLNRGGTLVTRRWGMLVWLYTCRCPCEIRRQQPRRPVGLRSVRSVGRDTVCDWIPTPSEQNEYWWFIETCSYL
jgi:hypothetical protein